MGAAPHSAHTCEGWSFCWTGPTEEEQSMGVWEVQPKQERDVWTSNALGRETRTDSGLSRYVSSIDAHTHKRARMHAQAHAHAQTHMYICTHTRTRTNAHAQTHGILYFLHTHTRTNAHACTHKHAHTRTCMHAHRHTHARTHMHARAHMHMHMSTSLHATATAFLSLRETPSRIVARSVFIDVDLFHLGQEMSGKLW